MPEPTASTSNQRFLVQPVIAAVIAAILLACSPAATLGQDANTAKLRAEAKKLKQPLIKDFEVARTKFRRQRTTFERILRQGAANQAEKRKLAEGIEHNLNMMTDPDLRRPDLQELRDKFLRTLDKAAPARPGTISKRKSGVKLTK